MRCSNPHHSCMTMLRDQTFLSQPHKNSVEKRSDSDSPCYPKGANASLRHRSIALTKRLDSG